MKLFFTAVAVVLISGCNSSVPTRSEPSQSEAEFIKTLTLQEKVQYENCLQSKYYSHGDCLVKVIDARNMAGKTVVEKESGGISPLGAAAAGAAAGYLLRGSGRRR